MLATDARMTGCKTDFLCTLETTAEILYWWRFTTQIRAVTLHQYGISALFPQTSFRVEASGSVSKTRNVYFFLMLWWSRLVHSRMFTLVLLVKVLEKQWNILNEFKSVIKWSFPFFSFCFGALFLFIHFPCDSKPITCIFNIYFFSVGFIRRNGRMW